MKPILKILTLPFFFLSLFMSFVVNFIILCLFDRIVNNILMIE
ncbi:MAG: phage holin family protein [Candidatus Peribacteria bacterium]|nr:phage holin family protein [Candidatus Peribacteria bacterium]